MKKIKLKVTDGVSAEISLQIYHQTVNVHIGSYQMLKHTLAEKVSAKSIEIIDSLNENNPHYLNLSNGEDDLHYVVYPLDILNVPVGRLVNIIAHESLHATQQILEDAAMPLNEGSSEAYAYLLGYITENTYDFLQKFKS
jgi:hypothetical protein